MKINLLSQKHRLTSYITLMLLCTLLPYIITIGCITLTQDRIEGMKIAMFGSILIPHFIYGFIILKYDRIKKIIYTSLLSIVVLGINIFLIKNELGLITGWDLYGYWDMILLNFLTGSFVWELFHQLSMRIKIMS